MLNLMTVRRAVTEAWTDQVRARLKEEDRSQRWLADQVGTTAATISLLLAGGIQASPFVESVSEVLEIPLQPLGPTSGALSELFKVAQGLPEEDIRALADMGKRMTKK